MSYSKELMDRIVNNLMVYASGINDLGLYHGKMGIILFFAHYARYTNESVYDDFAGNLLDDVFEKINTGLSIDFESGLAGIGWGIEYLLQNQFVEGSSNDILEEVDIKIMQHDIRRFRDLSIKTGIEGISYYVSKRIDSSLKNNEALPFDKIYLSEWKTAYNNPIPPDKQILLNIINNLPDDDNIVEWELGLESGCAGWGLKQIV